MAKAAMSKRRGQVTPRINSRALRRQTSPSLAGNVDRSLKEIPRPSSTDNAQTRASSHVLAPHSSSRISKKPKRGKQSRAQRLRSEKSKVKAERNQDILGEKVKESKNRGKKIRERSEVWEAVEEEIKSGIQGNGKRDDGTTTETSRRQGPEKTGGRPLNERMEAVELFETQDALGDLLVSEELETPNEARGKEMDIRVSGAQKRLDNTPIIVSLPTATEVLTKAIGHKSDEGITDGIT